MIMTHRRHKIASAFTLVEVMMVLVILGITLLVIAGMSGNTDMMQTQAAAQQVVALLTYAQNRAIAEQDDFKIVFDAGGNGYELQDSTGVVVSGDVTNVANSLYQINLGTAGRFKKTSIQSPNFDGSDSVWFDRMGGPHGGSIIANPTVLGSGSVVIACGDDSLTVAIEPVTGRISVVQN